MENLSRRRALTLSLALAFSGAAGSARALTWQEADAEAAFLLENRCGTSAYHERLIAEVEKALDGRKLSDEERKIVLAQLTCPACGCQVMASAGKF